MHTDLGEQNLAVWFCCFQVRLKAWSVNPVFSVGSSVQSSAGVRFVVGSARISIGNGISVLLVCSAGLNLAAG